MKRKPIIMRRKRRKPAPGIWMLLPFFAVPAILLTAWLFWRAEPQSPPAPSASPPPALSTPVPTLKIEPLIPQTPAPTPDGLSVEGDRAFTVAWLSDTQYYSEAFPEIFKSMTRFLHENQDRMKLGYVVHTGDLVNERNEEAQWQNAKSAMDELLAIPYGVTAGNHDAGTKAQSYVFYGRYFGEEAMRARAGGTSYYGGLYENNRGHYDLVELGENRFIFAYMSYAPDTDALKWLNKTFDAYADRIGVLCVHDYFKSDMTLSDAGSELLKKVVKKNENVYMVLCGHRYNVGMQPIEVEGKDGRSRTVCQLMQNYQAAGDMGGSGYMQFLQFDDAKKEVRVISYSPHTNDRRYFDTPGAELEKYAIDPENEEYTFPYPWE